MSIASDTVPLFRTHWANRFVDAGTLTRETAIGTFNETTGQHDSPTTPEIWDGTGGCLIRPAARSSADFGETPADVETYNIFVPYTATTAKPGDRFNVSASVYNADLVGAVLVVTEVVEDSYLTHYQWVAERVKS